MSRTIRAHTLRDRQGHSKVSHLNKTKSYQRFYGTITAEELDRRIRLDIEWHEKVWAKGDRDGAWAETGRNEFYKRLNKKHVRNETNRLKHKVMKDPDAFDDLIVPGDFMGKKFIWSVW